jgi:uncharacterized membrane protein
MLRKLALAAAAGAGLYVADHMQRKVRRARAGELDEPSIVERPAARAAFGVSNAAFGLAYYGALLAAVPLSDKPPVKRAMLAGSSLALAMSLYLMYSLAFRTRMPCPYCWTGHALNIVLFSLTLSNLS